MNEYYKIIWILLILLFISMVMGNPHYNCINECYDKYLPWINSEFINRYYNCVRACDNLWNYTKFGIRMI